MSIQFTMRNVIASKTEIFVSVWQGHFLPVGNLHRKSHFNQWIIGLINLLIYSETQQWGFASGTDQHCLVNTFFLIYVNTFNQVRWFDISLLWFTIVSFSTSNLTLLTFQLWREERYWSLLCILKSLYIKWKLYKIFIIVIVYSYFYECKIPKEKYITEQIIYKRFCNLIWRNNSKNKS